MYLRTRQMDHFPVFDACYPPLRVPSLSTPGSDNFYDNQGFYGYPGRRGWGIEDEVSLSGRDTEETNNFLQSWLYFGFLAEAMSIIDVQFQMEEFIDQDPTGSCWISTRHLPRYLETWRYQEKQGESLDPHDYEPVKLARLSSLKRLVMKVRDWVKVLSGTESSKPDNLGPEYLATTGPLSPELATIIMALDFALTRAAILIWSLRMGAISDNVGQSEYLLSGLLENGWCPHDVHMIRSMLSVDTEYYFRSFLPIRGQRDHTNCSELQCQAENIDETAYLVRHVTEECDCKFAGPDINAVVSSLQHDGIPLVVLSSTDPTVIRVMDWQTDNEIDYIAVSHVWADGLGNPRTNSLPLCQLTRVQQMANLAHALDNDVPTYPVAFWMDTLCVPVEPQHKEHRQTAIRRMRDTYARAKKVLVLDSEIQSGSREAQFLECSARIFTSSWLRRLWTLQEGVFANDICFQFRDGPRSLSSLHGAFLDDLREGGSFYTVVGASLLSLFYVCLRSFDLDATPERLLINIWTSLEWRTTSNPSDEAICIATLMGIDPVALLQTVPQDRMQTLLCAIKILPPGIIFLSGERLSVEGFRWAPKSLLGRKKGTYPYPLQMFYSRTLWTSTALATIDAAGGLRASFPGFLLSQQPDSQITLPFDLLYEGVGTLRRCEVQALQGESLDLLEESDSIEYAIVLSERVAMRRKVVGALVSLQGEMTSECFAANFLSRVWVNLVDERAADGNPTIQMEKKGAWSIVAGTFLSDEQQWRIF
jgi:Heterokaryon incompatibility protein (HET)